MTKARTEGPAAYVAGAMQRHFPMVDAQATLEEARQKMNETVSSYVVVSDGERLLGLVTELELTRHMVAGQAMASGFKLPRFFR